MTELSQAAVAASEQHRAAHAVERTKMTIFCAMHDAMIAARNARDEAANELDDALEAFFIARRRRRSLHSSIDAYDTEYEKLRDQLNKTQWEFLRASLDDNAGELARIAPEYARILAAFDTIHAGPRAAQYQQDKADFEKADKDFDAALEAKNAAKEKLDRLEKDWRTAEATSRASYEDHTRSEEEQRARGRDLSMAVFAQFHDADQQAFRKLCQEREDAGWAKYYPTF
jgi:hypothetical protein